MSDPVRVAVTRDEGPDGPLSSALRARGLMPVACPVVRAAPPEDLAPLARAAGELDRYDWLVVASRRAVDGVMAARGARPLPPKLRTAAVGAATADALRAAGATEPFMAPTAGAAPLAQALCAAHDWSRRLVLLPRAAEGGRDLADALRAAGAEVEEVVAYRTLPRDAGEIARDWQEGAADVAVFASPSAVHALAGSVGAEALRGLRAVVAIGTTTGTALAKLDVPAHLAEDASFGAVAARVSELVTTQPDVSLDRAAHHAVPESKA